MAKHEYVYVWAYEVRPECVAAFERTYGPEGEWVALFRTGRGYRSTRLLRDRERPGRYLTIDTWASAEAFEAFRRERAAAFEALDRRCERLTLSETALGRFDVVDPADETGAYGRLAGERRGVGDPATADLEGD